MQRLVSPSHGGPAILPGGGTRSGLTLNQLSGAKDEQRATATFHSLLAANHFLPSLFLPGGDRKGRFRPDDQLSAHCILPSAFSSGGEPPVKGAWGRHADSLTAISVPRRKLPQLNEAARPAADNMSSATHQPARTSSPESPCQQDTWPHPAALDAP